MTGFYDSPTVIQHILRNVGHIRFEYSESANVMAHYLVVKSTRVSRISISRAQVLCIDIGMHMSPIKKPLISCFENACRRQTQPFRPGSTNAI